MTKKQMINVLLEFMKQAGEIALREQKNLDSEKNYLKEKNVMSVVTTADLEISKLFQQFIATHFADMPHVIVDEESLKSLGKDKWQTITQAKYQFIIDPIDGTLPYSCNQALYGISVGVFFEGEPYCGFLYMPATQELVYSDGKIAYLKQNAFQPNEEDKKLDTQGKNTCKIIFGHYWNTPPTKHFKLSEVIMLNYYSAVVQLLYLVTKRAKGYAFYMSIWDLAGGWVIAQAMGLHVYHLQDGKEVTKFSPEDFDDKLHLKNVCVMCDPKDLEYLREVLTVSPKLQ